MKRSLLYVISRCTLNTSKSVRLFVIMVCVIVSCSTAASLQAQTPGTEYDELLTSLLNDLHPTVYLANGQITSYGTSTPEVLVCDAATASLLYTDNPLFTSVKLIRLQIDAANSLPSIDLSALPSFQTLQYFMVEFTYDQCGGQSDACLNALVQEHINSAGTSVLVLTKLSIPN